jgi:hypothetical protein
LRAHRRSRDNRIITMRHIAYWFVALAACGSNKAGSPSDAAIDATPDAAPDAGLCPDQRGAYSVALSGAGCGDLDATAPQCITQPVCTITLAATSGSSGTALNGTAMLGMDGSFTGAAITEGTVNRTGCTGTWAAGTSTLTVDCGGIGSSQSCVATLTRTSKTCP